MKAIGIITAILISMHMYGQEEIIFTLEPNQNMSITGQGPGQNAAINPFEGEDCKAIIKNIGKNTLGLRVKDKNDKVTITPIEPKEIKTLYLYKGSILYFDSDLKAMVSLTFAKI